jgi:Icc-related predicted phosphoesterase
MRLFCFSDTHQRALPDCEPAPDAWLFSGDLYEKPDRGGLTAEDVEFRDSVRTWREKYPQPIYSVRGNHDLHDRARFFQSSIELTEGVVRSLGDGLFIAGMGWTGKQFFDLPLESHLLERCQRIEDEWARLGKPARLIFLTHYAPNDRAMIPYRGEKDGFFFDCIRDLIYELKPLAVVVGHSHAHFGLITRLANSTIVFPGNSGQLLIVENDRVSIGE